MIKSRDNQTIVAQCTPKGSGAIALIRISGDDAISIASRLSRLASGKALSDVATHTIHYGDVLDEHDKVIDHCMFLLMRAPRTFTGQNTVEITCHNNQFLIDAIIERAISLGARVAGNGEFTRRSFLHGKVDLIQAEAINELIHASNQRSLQQSLAQLDGSFSQWLTGIEKKMVLSNALCEASFEFIDEEDLEFNTQIKQHVETILSDIARIKKGFSMQQQIRDGIRVALIGSVNAGKSSLFNALLEKERAIVTNIAGTTRDVIEAGLYKDGLYWTFVDTAGLRSTDDLIEQEGIKRSFEQAEKADVILLVYDQSKPLFDHEQTVYKNILKKFGDKAILIANKADLQNKYTVSFADSSAISASASKKERINLVHEAISLKVDTLLCQLDSPFLLNKRHMSVLIEVEKKLNQLLPMLQGEVAYELVSVHINDILQSLTDLTGKSISEQSMDAVFREFCVGK